MPTSAGLRPPLTQMTPCGGAVTWSGFGAVGDGFEHVVAVVDRSLEIGLEAHGFVVVGYGAIEIAFGLACNGPVVEVSRVARLKANCFVVVPNRAFQVVYGLERDAPIAKGVGVVGF